MVELEKREAISFEERIPDDKIGAIRAIHDSAKTIGNVGAPPKPEATVWGGICGEGQKDGKEESVEFHICVEQE